MGSCPYKLGALAVPAQQGWAWWQSRQKCFSAAMVPGRRWSRPSTCAACLAPVRSSGVRQLSLPKSVSSVS